VGLKEGAGEVPRNSEGLAPVSVAVIDRTYQTLSVLSVSRWA
jgi:hypothetical protein